MKYYMRLDMDIPARIVCFDLVRGMDLFMFKHGLVFADPNVNKDFHSGKKLPRFHDDGEEDLDYNTEMLEDGGIWYFDDCYSLNGDFRATVYDGAKVSHGETEFEVFVDVVSDNETYKFYLLPNQAMIRALLVLMFLKQPKQSHFLSKVPVELFRLLKSFLEN